MHSLTLLQFTNNCHNLLRCSAGFKWKALILWPVAVLRTPEVAPAVTGGCPSPRTSLVSRAVVSLPDESDLHHGSQDLNRGRCTIA